MGAGGALVMDVVRYADSNGFERDEFLSEHYRYRDYLIRAFNADKPFDQFIREQIAGMNGLPGLPGTKRTSTSDRNGISPDGSL